MPIVSDNFYQQTKDLFAESETEEYAVAIAVAPTVQKANYPSGKALVITVKEESEFSKMNWKSIRGYIRDHQLQGAIRSALGKSVSECRLEELRRALEDFAVDQQYELAQDLV